MNANALLTVSVLSITIFTGSDILKAEILTDFEIEHDQMHSGQKNVLHIRNTGFIQADNAIVLIAANGTISDFTDLCAEGQISRLDGGTLVAEFTKMSPRMECAFELNVLEPILLNTTISSDGRIIPWDETSSWGKGLWAIIILLGVLIAEAAVLYYVLKTSLWRTIRYGLEFLPYRNIFIEAPKTQDTINFIREEYAIRINRIDATILKLIYCGKTTMGQLRRYSNLSGMQITYRIKKLRQHELIHQGTLTIDKALQNYFESNESPK